jgi:putative peptidoglycan lipid II flippase
MVLNALLSLWLPGVFAARGWFPLGGLALANSAATFLEMLVLLYLMRRRLQGLEGRRLLSGLGQAGLASALMGLGLWWWLGAAAGRSVWLVGVAGIAIGGLIYGAAVWLLRVPEVNEVIAAVRSRLKPAG